ncbi:AAA family ATPase [Piscinibacter sp.]|jgi:aminoglycoside phosphotransferase family enzyme/predicted kinase|uniref:bifunctional aminoglycoside phosphotransferase/ATP-binding protein n=1 Tax=Piscinibacter sp. TaxID=1903157 RepID=UPI003559391E
MPPRTHPDPLTTGATLVDALRRQLPAELIETHISWVLLTPQFAFKIKKPVRFAFVDFSTLDLRRHCCEEELRLNRRLAPSIYLEVVEIRGTLDDPKFEGSGPLLEVAVKMRRFAPDALFSERLARGTLTPQHLDRLAQRVAAFHRAAPRAEADMPYGSAAAIERATGRAYEAVEAAAPQLRAWLQAQSRTLRPLWAARRDAGWVRECHGDLHLANIVLLGDDATAFDCIEFDPALRWIDVASDVAFLVMDLLAHRRRDLAFRFLNAWLEDIGDVGSLSVLRYYMVYRAVVRAQVALLRGASEGAAPDYLALACSLACPGDPRLLITHGLPGSGKSFVSQQLLECAGAIRIRSDVERKRLFGLAPTQRSRSQDIYDAATTQRTYEALRSLARSALQAGWPTIVDAANLRRDERAQFRELADALRVPFAILDCEAPIEVLRERVRARELRRDDASEADAAVLERLNSQREPLDDAERTQAIRVDTRTALAPAALAADWLARTAP